MRDITMQSRQSPPQQSSGSSAATAFRQHRNTIAVFGTPRRHNSQPTMETSHQPRNIAGTSAIEGPPSWVNGVRKRTEERVNKSLTAQRKEQQAYMFLCKVKEAYQWIVESLEGRINPNRLRKPKTDENMSPKDLCEWLQDGVALCELVNAIRPGTIRKINFFGNSQSQHRFKHLENILFFLDAAPKLAEGTNRKTPLQLFTPLDLFEQKNPDHVVTCIHEVASIAAERGFQPRLKPLSRGEVIFNDALLEDTKKNLPTTHHPSSSNSAHHPARSIDPTSPFFESFGQDVDSSTEEEEEEEEDKPHLYLLERGVLDEMMGKVQSEMNLSSGCNFSDGALDELPMTLNKHHSSADLSARAKKIFEESRRLKMEEQETSPLPLTDSKSSSPQKEEIILSAQDYAVAPVSLSLPPTKHTPDNEPHMEEAVVLPNQQATTGDDNTAVQVAEKIESSATIGSPPLEETVTIVEQVISEPEPVEEVEPESAPVAEIVICPAPIPNEEKVAEVSDQDDSTDKEAPIEPQAPAEVEVHEAIAEPISETSNTTGPVHQEEENARSEHTPIAQDDQVTTDHEIPTHADENVSVAPVDVSPSLELQDKQSQTNDEISHHDVVLETSTAETNSVIEISTVEQEINTTIAEQPISSSDLTEPVSVIGSAEQIESAAPTQDSITEENKEQELLDALVREENSLSQAQEVIDSVSSASQNVEILIHAEVEASNPPVEQKHVESQPEIIISAAPSTSSDGVTESSDAEPSQESVVPSTTVESQPIPTEMKDDGPSSTVPTDTAIIEEKPDVLAEESPKPHKRAVSIEPAASLAVKDETPELKTKAKRSKSAVEGKKKSKDSAKDLDPEETSSKSSKSSSKTLRDKPVGKGKSSAIKTEKVMQMLRTQKKRKSKWNADEIVPGVYIGDRKASQDKEELRAHGITHILSAIGNEPDFPDDFKYMIFEALDSSFQDIMFRFNTTSAFIEEARQQGGVLVHCMQGISRSATLVIAWIMEYMNYTFYDAADLVVQQRPACCPNLGFIKQLQLFEALKFKLRGDSPHHQQYRIFKLKADIATLRDTKWKRGEGRIVESDLTNDPLDPNAVEPNIGIPVPVQSLNCRSCQRPLFCGYAYIEHANGEDVLFDDPDKPHQIPPCNSLYAFPSKWMASNVNDASSQIVCPGCSTNVGAWDWNAELPCACGFRHKPAFRLDIDKIDIELK